MSDVEDLQAFLQQQKVPDVYGLPELKAGKLRIEGPPVEGQYSQAEADRQAQDYPEETYAHHVGLPDIEGPDMGMPVPTKPGMQFETPPDITSTDDLKAFLDSRKDQDTAAIRQRATGILNQYRTDANFHLPPEWYDSLVREATAGTTPTGQVVAAAKGIGEAFLPVPFSKEATGVRIPLPIPTWETTKAAAGAVAGGLKSAGQFIQEIGNPEFERRDVRGGAAHGVASGVLGLDALVGNAEQAVMSQFQDPEQRIQALKQLWQQDHENAATVQNLDKLMGYQKGTAPGTEAVTEFAAASLPFVAAPELAAAGKVIPGVASKIVEDVIPGVVGGVGRVAPTAWKAATGTFNVAAKVLPPLAKVKKIYNAASGLMDLLSSYAPEAKNAAEVGVQTPLFKYGDLVKSLTDTPEGMTFVEPMQQGVKDEIVRLNKSFDLQAKAAGEKVDLNAVRSVEKNGKFTVDAEHLNPQEQKLRQIQQQLIDQRSKFDTLENYSKIINLGKDAAKLGIGQGLTLGAGGVTMGGIASLQAMPDDVERAAMEGVPTGMALTTPALLPEAIKTMQVSRGGRIKAAGDYQAYKGSQVPPHPDAAPLSEQGQRAVNIVNGSIWEGGGQAVPVTREKMADLTKSTPETAPMGYYDPDTMTAYLRQDAVERYGQNGPVGHEFTHALDQLTGDTATKAYGTILDGVKDPNVGFRLKDFLYNYMSAARRTDPTMKTMSLDSLMSEGAAELARYILAKTPLEELMSGKTYQKVISDKISDAIAAVNGTSGEVFTAPGFGTPFTRQQYRAMENAIYDWGKQVRRGDVTRPEVPGVTPEAPGAAPAAEVKIPPEVSKLNEKWAIPEDILKQAIQRAAPNAVPADIMVDALKMQHQGGKPPAPAAAPAEAPEGKAPVDEWKAEADRKVKEFMDQGIPEDQAIMQAADAMQDWEKNRPPTGRKILNKFMPEMAPQTEEFKRWSGGAPVILNAGPRSFESTMEDIARTLDVVGNDNTGYTVVDNTGKMVFGGISPPLSLLQATKSKAHLAENMTAKEMSKAEAAKFQTGQPVVVGAYHGTPSDTFHTFDETKLGVYTGAPSAKQGFFFSGLPDTAESYKGGLLFPLKGFKDMTIQQRGHLATRLMDSMLDEYNGPEGLWRMDPHWGRNKDAPRGEAVQKWSLNSNNGHRIADGLDQAEAEKMMKEHNAGVVTYNSTADYANAHPDLFMEFAKKITGKEDFDTSPADVGHLHEVYVKMQNPYVHDFKGQSYREESYYNLLRSAKQAGHDGAIFTNTYDGGGKPDNIFVTFDNKNIKSTANMGTFDPSNPDIRYMPDVGDFQKLAKDAGYEFQGDLDGVLFWKNPDTGHEITAEPWRGKENAIADFKDKLSGKYVPGQDLDRYTKAQAWGDYGERKRLKREGEEGGQYMPEVNVGLHVNGVEKLTSKDVADALEAVPGVKITKLSEQRLKGREPTVVATLSRALTADEGHAVSEALGQDVIAQHQMGGQGNLFGPRPEGYGADPNIPNSGFNPDEFVTHEGKILSDVMHRLPTRTGASGIWDRMSVDPNFMQGEFEKSAEATGANPKERFYRQTPAAQKAIQDYFKGRGQAQFMPDAPLSETYSIEERKDGRWGVRNKNIGGTTGWYEATRNTKEEATKYLDHITNGRWSREQQGEAQYMPSPAGDLRWTSRHFDMTPDQLEQFLIFGRSVAGHASKDRAPMIERMLTGLLNEQGGTSPIAALQKLNQTPGGIENLVKQYRFGPYGENIKFLQHLAESRIPDLKTATEEELMNIPGIGPKTARFFKAHTDATRANNVMLDTHILRFLRETGHPDAPMSTPQDPKVYQKWSEAFRNTADEFGLSPSDLDLQIWLDRSGNMPTESYRGLEAIGADRQFMPNTHPDAIKEPAFQTRDGEIISAPVGYHSLIPLTKEQKLKDIWRTGFVTNKGEFLDRKQALAAALKHKQITEEAADPRNWTETAVDEQLHAPDVTEGTTPPWSYMPSPHPDAVGDTAIRTPDGKIWTGKWAAGRVGLTKEEIGDAKIGAIHPEIDMALQEAGDYTDTQLNNAIDGYVSNKHTPEEPDFMTRTQAYFRARQQHQLDVGKYATEQRKYQRAIPDMDSLTFEDSARFMPDPEEQINLARDIAQRAHKGQERKFTGEPYFGHLDDVASLVNDKLKPAAYLHDVFEDTPLRVADLRSMGVPENTIQLIRNLSRRPNEDYSHFIDRIKGNQDARDIKVADLMHNLFTLPESSSLRGRYVKALNQLVPSDQEVKDALNVTQRLKFGAHRDLPPGTMVGNRIDINAFNRTGKYAITTHDGSGYGVGPVLGYDSIGTVDNPIFYSDEAGAAQIAGGHNKFPIATVKGEFNPSRTLPQDIGDYTMAGYNPVKHSYFYEKGTGQPIIAGDRAISTGNTVFVKNPVYGNPAGFKYMPDMPTAIDRAALKNKETGEIIAGGQNDTHFMIPATSGKADDYLGPNGHKIYEEGFIDHNGNWYNRMQAQTQMKALGQLPPQYQGEYKDELNVTGLKQARQTAELKPPEPDKPFLYMPSTPEDAAAAITEGRQKFPEAFPRDYEKDKDGNYKLKYDKQAKKKQYVPVEKPFDLTQSGLYEQSKDQADFENKMVDKVVQEHNNVWSKDPETMQAKGWYDTYNTMREKGMSHEQATRFLETAAATSARARAGSQFIDSLEAHNRMEAGDFDEIIKKYKEAYDKQKSGDLTFNKDYTNPQKKAYKEGDAVDSASAFRDYVEANNLVLRKSPKPGQDIGKRFGMHSYKVLQVMAGHYVPEGLKYIDFFNALTGRSTNPVIDIWSYRNIDRLANEGYKDVWRRLPENEPGVNDPDYLTSRRIMLGAAKKLGYDNPTDLQAIQWFGEKKQWFQNKWARELDLGDYRPLLNRFEPVPGAKGTQFRLADVQPPR